ncbi:MAG TPA: cupredoxin domain-containing protein [Actinomycetota bacterium]|jgi:plastocyanin
MSDRPSREGLLLPVLLPLGALVLIGLVLFGFSRILLATSADAATGVALIVAAAIMTTAALIASRRRQPNGVLFSLFGIVAGVAMVAGGIAVLAFAPAEGEGEGFVAVLAAPVGAAVDGFSPDRLPVPSGEPVSIEFDNQDAGIQHNVVVFDGEDDSAPTLAEGTIITGVAKETVSLEPLQPGSYFFHCAVHPSTMTGTIEASEGGGGGAGGGLVVSASGLAFDTDVINLPADQPTQLTFDNKDPAVVHNIAIFPDEQSLDAPLFDGANVTGPDQIVYDLPAFAVGTYYFHCNTHPTMAGSVVVEAGGGGGGGGEPPPPTGATGAGGPSG